MIIGVLRSNEGRLHKVKQCHVYNLKEEAHEISFHFYFLQFLLIMSSSFQCMGPSHAL